MKFLSQINVNTEYTLPIVDGNNGQVLTTDGNGAVYWGNVSAGVTNLDGLTDVILTSPSSGQLLRYGIPPGSGEANPVWYNFTPTYLTPSSSIDALSDVTISTATTGQILQWSGSQWVNATLSTVEYVSKVQHLVKCGVAVTKGQAVYVTSADGTNMIVGLASNASEPTSSKVIGLAASTGAINDQIFVVTEGLIAGLNTSTANAGDPVWLGTGGNLIFGLLNKPVAPAHLVYLGVVTRVQSNNGEIFVNVQNGFELHELHDVLISSPSAGQLIRRDSDGLWKNWSPNFLTAEADTLQTVTTRGASTNLAISANGVTSPNFTSTALMIINADSSGSLQPDQGSPANKILSFRWQGLEGGYIDTNNVITFAGFKTPTGTASQFLKANGTVDSSTYLTTTTAATTYATFGYVDDEITAVNTYVQDYFVPKTRTLTINGTSYDLSANRSWTIATTDSTKVSKSGESHDTVEPNNLGAGDGGFYTVKSGFGPSGGNDALIHIPYSNSDWAHQLAFDWALGNNQDMWFRTKNGGTWQGWRKVWHDGNFTDNSTNWNTAYNDRITAAAVSGTSTKTLTLTQGDGGTVTATWTDYDTDNDAQVLTWTAPSKELAISNGNSITLDGLATEDYVLSQGFTTFQPWNSGTGSINYTAGNVGIGTASPNYKLDITGGSVRLTQDYSQVILNGITLRGYSADNLWVIGNSTRASINLGTSWDWDTQVAIAYTPNTPGAGQGGLAIGQTTKNSSTWTHGSTSFYTLGTERVTIDSSGNVGIGTTSPAEKLHVVGAAIFDGGAGNSSTDSVLYVTKSNSNDWGLYVNASGVDYGMYVRISPSAGYAFGIHNGTTWTTRITGDGRIHLNSKDTIASYDSWLRLNQSGEYTSGVYTPAGLRNDGAFENYGGIYGYNTIRGRKAQTNNNYTTAALWTESYDNTTTGIAFHISGNVGKFLEMRTDGVLYWENAKVWTAATDGSGSGLDADTVDGIHASTFATRQDGARYSTDVNSLMSSGFYNVEGQPANSPVSYGQIIVAKGIDTAFQIAGGYSNNALYFRGQGYGPESGGFYPWRRVWHNDDFSSTNISNWNAAYNDRITAAAVTGTSTKTLTLTQGDGGTVTATWTDYDTDTDAQQLTWDPAQTELSISGGNDVTLTGLATEDYVNSQGFVTSVQNLAIQTIGGDSGAFNLDTVSGQHGFVRFSTGAWAGTNPYPGNYSHILSINQSTVNGNRFVQMYLGDVPGALFWRMNQGGTIHPWERIWTAGNDGSGSGLDADLLDGYNHSNFIGLNGNSYFQLTTWLQSTGNHGFYSPSSGAGTHFYPAVTSYGSFRIEGGANSFLGIELFTLTRKPTWMWDNNGGGMYSQSDSVWYYYYSHSSGRLHIGASSGNAVWHSGDFTSTNISNWNAAYNDRITAVAVSGTGTKTLTLTQQDGGTLTATWTDYDTDNDAQTLSWDQGQTLLSISGGNDVTLTGLATEDYVNSQGFVTSSGTVAGVVRTVTGTNSAELVRGNMGDNDQARILVGATASNAGYLEIATADDGTEPIYVRQYTGVFSSLTRTATLLDGSGNTTFPGNLTIGGTFTENSSIRFKENIQPLEPALAKVEQLNPVTYTKITSQEEEIGLIAEEVAELFPEVVTYNENGQPQGIQYQRLSVILLKAVQELTERVNKLENK